MENYYKILGVSESSSKDEIKKSYRKLVMKYHPDKNPDNPKAQEIFYKIQKAYETLSDDNQREKYNELLKNGNNSQKQNKQENTQKQKNYSKKEFNFNDFSQNFKNYFGFDPDTGEKLNKQNNVKAQKVNTNDFFESFFKVK
jgi:DnaJ-class molecular chaperone